MAMNKEAAAVIAEKRARKVNHGKSASPTLLTWADRFEFALSVSADPGDVLVHCSGKEIAGRIGFSNANAPPTSCNPTTQPASAEPVSIAALLSHEQLSAFASSCGYSNDEAFFTLELLDAAIAGAPQPSSCNPTTPEPHT